MSLPEPLKTSDPPPSPDSPPTVARADYLSRLDDWMAQNPWHPRVVPFLVFVALIPVVSWVLDNWPPGYVIVLTLRSALVVALLWRYRRLLPELTLSFDVLAVPVGVAVAWAWIVLGIWMIRLNPAWFDTHQPVDFRTSMRPALGNTALVFRLVTMAVVVPVFEELFIRSLMLRSLHSFRMTALGFLQFFQDLPVIGEWFGETQLGEQVASQPAVFGREFERTPLGALSFFGVTASTVVFMLSHVMRDWPGAIVCGVAYCLLLFATRRKGLGPVIWAHGITNALLWGYTLYSGDWRFL